MTSEPPRSREARTAAEAALVRVVNEYGGRPEFVLMGGLVPELICRRSSFRHAGTTDVDVQVNLEISLGSVNAVRLEDALRASNFRPDGGREWRWQTEGDSTSIVVKFELLADRDDVPSEATVNFDGCQDLGAVNLRGTGFAAEDSSVMSLAASIDDLVREVEVNVTRLAGYLLSKTRAAHSRRKTKDWYDIAFVLLHNDDGGPRAAASSVLALFADRLVGATQTALDDLLANFQTTDAQGPQAYASQMVLDYPEMEFQEVAVDAVVAVREFHEGLFGES